MISIVSILVTGCHVKGMYVVLLAATDKIDSTYPASPTAVSASFGIVQTKVEEAKPQLCVQRNTWVDG